MSVSTTKSTIWGMLIGTALALLMTWLLPKPDVTETKDLEWGLIAPAGSRQPEHSFSDIVDRSFYFSENGFVVQKKRERAKRIRLAEATRQAWISTGKQLRETKPDATPKELAMALRPEAARLLGVTTLIGWIVEQIIQWIMERIIERLIAEDDAAKQAAALLCPNPDPQFGQPD
jgi:hypothetical protein